MSECARWRLFVRICECVCAMAHVHACVPSACAITHVCVPWRMVDGARTSSTPESGVVCDCACVHACMCTQRCRPATYLRGDEHLVVAKSDTELHHTRSRILLVGALEEKGGHRGVVTRLFHPQLRAVVKCHLCMHIMLRIDMCIRACICSVLYMYPCV